MKIEQWRDIKNYEGLYQVSNHGRIKRIAKGQNNKLNNLKWGTHSENMQDSIKHGTFSILIIVAKRIRVQN